MKKSFKILGMMLAVAALPLMYSCEDEVKYTPAEPVSGPQVFFSSDLASTIELSEDATSFEVGILRADVSESISFSLSISGETEMFDIPTTVSFAAGSESATLTIGYDPDDFEYDDFVEVTMSIPEEYSTPYGLDSYTFSAGMSAPYISLGWCTYTDDFVGSMYGESCCLTWEVEIEENSANPGLFRLVNPYDEKYEWNDPGDWDPDNDYYLIINAVDPDRVYIPECDLGVDWGYGNMVAWSMADYYMQGGYTADEVAAAGYFGTYKDGVITFPQNALLCYEMDDLILYYGNYWGDFRVVMPGAEVEEPADYSVEVEYAGKYTDADDAEYVVAEVTMGADVEFAAVVLTEGSDPTSALYGILLDTIEYQTVTASGTVTFDAPTETGYYTVLAVSYGGEDYQYYDWDTFFYSVGSDGSVDPWVVETTGDYSYSGFYYEGANTGLILYSNSYDDTLYKIADWGAGIDFTFNWDKETNEVVVQEQSTGEVYGVYGDVYVCDLTDYYYALTYYGTPGYYEDGTFYFGIAYYCSGGGFGYGYETFKTKGGTLGVPLADVPGTYTVFESDAASGSAWYGEFVIEESDDPSKGNIMFTVFDDIECTISSVYGTYDETTGIAEVDCDQICGPLGNYYAAPSLLYLYDECPITFMFFNNDAFWGPFYGDYMTIDGYQSTFGTYIYAGYFYAYEYLYGVKDEAEPDSIKPASVMERSVNNEPLEKGKLKANINFSKKPVKNSAVKPTSVAPAERQKTGCQPVKRTIKKVVPPLPGAPTPGAK